MFGGELSNIISDSLYGFYMPNKNITVEKEWINLIDT